MRSPQLCPGSHLTTDQALPCWVSVSPSAQGEMAALLTNNSGVVVMGVSGGREPESRFGG